MLKIKKLNGTKRIYFAENGYTKPSGFALANEDDKLLSFDGLYVYLPLGGKNACMAILTEDTTELEATSYFLDER